MSFAPLLVLLFAGSPVVAWRLRSQGRRQWWAFLALGALAVGIEAMLAIHSLEVRKIIAAALMPMGFAWVLLMMALTDRWLRADRRGAALLAVLWVLLTLSGNATVAAILTRSLESDLPRTFDSTPFDAIFVLGGGTSFGPGGPELNGSGDRVAMAVELWRAARTPILVTSGSSLGAPESERSLADETAKLWRSLGVPDSAIVELRSSDLVNTEAEVQAYQAEAKRLGWKRVGLVTSAWHLRRALRICQRIGFEVTPLPSDWRSGTESRVPWGWIPQASALAQVEVVLKEYLGALKDG